MQAQSYDFPVTLQPMYTRSGEEVPRMRAVVRGDTHKPIATVSDRYHLVEHKTVVHQAEKFVRAFGKPQRNFSIARDGAVFIGEYTYKEQLAEVAKGDLVGLRVYIDSTYLAKSRLRVTIGGLVLRCLNGMVIPRDIFSVSYHHSSQPELHFPNPEEVLQVFKQQSHNWQRLAAIPLSEAQYRELSEHAVNTGVVQRGALAAVPEDPTAWSLYNQFTYHITHQSKASKLGQLNRLNKVGSWFNETFSKQ